MMETPYPFSITQHNTFNIDQTHDTTVYILATLSVYISELYASFTEESSIVLCKWWHVRSGYIIRFKIDIT